MFKKQFLFPFLLFVSTVFFAQKEYKKVYFDNGNLKEEGWILDNQKTAYWTFYYKNGNIKKEGHFKNNFETKYWYFYRKDSSLEKKGHYKKGMLDNWWLYYDKKGNLIHKCQLKDNKRNGYCFIYSKKKLVKALKFKGDKKINEWTDFSSFRKENNLNDLR